MPTVRTGPMIGLTAQVGLLAVLAATIGLSLAGWLVGLACGLVTNVLLARALTRSGASAMGPADRVTLVRATLVGCVAALVADAFIRPAELTAMVSLSIVALILDAVDGWVARRTGSATALGARFDMEVDAFLIFVLSVYVAYSLGPWVLVIGAARYAYVLAGWALPWLCEPVPPRYWRKTVAAIEGIVLTFAAAAILPEYVIDVALFTALALLGESFGRDVWWLWRRRNVRCAHRLDVATVDPGSAIAAARSQS